MSGLLMHSKTAAAPLQRDSHVALYRQIAERLRGEILADAFGASGKLPSEKDLTDLYGVSRVTVRLAIGHLLNEGLVIRKQGKGTFVARSVVHHDLKELQGLYDVLVSQGLSPETELLRFAPLRPPPEVADALAAGEGKLVLLQRLYRLEGQAIGLATTWLPLSAKRVTWIQAESHYSYDILQNLLGFTIVRAEYSIRGQTAGREVAQVLELDRGAPVLVLERRSYDLDDAALEMTRFVVNSESYEFNFVARGPSGVNKGPRVSVIQTR
jgi:GntR family transcriptional regulator